MATLKLYLVGSHSTRLWLNKEVLSDLRIEVVGGADCSERAREEIVHAQPHVVIHATDICEEKELPFLHSIKEKLPATCYVVLGNVLNFAFRVRCSSSGVDLVLSLTSESYKVRDLLRRLVYNLASTGICVKTRIFPDTYPVFNRGTKLR